MNAVYWKKLNNKPHVKLSGDTNHYYTATNKSIIFSVIYQNIFTNNRATCKSDKKRYFLKGMK